MPLVKFSPTPGASSTPVQTALGGGATAPKEVCASALHGEEGSQIKEKVTFHISFISSERMWLFKKSQCHYLLCLNGPHVLPLGPSLSASVHS